MTRSPADPAAAHPLPSPKERRRLREAKSLSEEQVATAVGVTRATVRSWETGRSTPRGRKREVYARLIDGGRTGPQATPPNSRTKTATANTRPKAAAKRAARPTSPTTVARLPRSVVSTKPGPSAQPSPRPPNPVEATGSTAMAPTEPGTTPDLPGTSTTRRAPATSRTSTAPATPVAPEKPAAPAKPARPRASAAPTTPTTPPASPAAPENEAAEDRSDGDRTGGLSPAEAFDALYRHSAEALFRQAFLLTGRRGLARESVARAFSLAWDHWPEVAVDRDPVGWVRAAAYEYAVSPWHRLRRTHRRPDPPQAEPGARALLDALLELPPSYRRTLLLHDGVGLDLPDTAAETEASTPAAASRLVNARAAIAEQLSSAPTEPGSEAGTAAGAGSGGGTDSDPGAGTGSGRSGSGPEASADRPVSLHEQLGALALAQPCGSLLPPAVIREVSERKAQLWTRAAVSFTVLIIGLTLFTLATAAVRYETPASPARQVDGVPPHSGPQKLTPKDLKLRKKLHGELVQGPARLVPGTG
ncbi:sigma factor-like helix-turn-helix DNA-binding protein [Streptomyces sp. NPDC001732]